MNDQFEGYDVKFTTLEACETAGGHCWHNIWVRPSNDPVGYPRQVCNHCSAIRDKEWGKPRRLDMRR